MSIKRQESMSFLHELYNLKSLQRFEAMISAIDTQLLYTVQTLY